MAEDLHNPLNNPAAEPVGQDPTPPSEEPEANDELSEFLSDYFESEPRQQAEETPAEPAPSPPQAAAEPVSEGEPADTAPETPSSPSPPPAAEVEPTEPPTDDLQRRVLERLNEQLERMNAPTEPAQQAEQVTPDQMVQHYQPVMQQYVDGGWLDEDFVALYPKQAALMVHMWQMGTNMQQGVQETQQYTQAEQERRSQEDATRQLNSAMDEVTGRGDVYDALKDAEVRQGFQDFLINEVNPRLSQVTPDFLAKQFYAFHHQLIFDTIRQQQSGGQADAQPVQGEPTAAQLAQQEGSSSRAAPTSPDVPEFVSMLEGHPAERWYQ